MDVRKCEQCGTEYIVSHPRQKYCNIRCTDRAAHKKARRRAQVGEDRPEVTKALDEYRGQDRRWIEIRNELRREDEAAALREVLGYTPSKKIIGIEPVPDTGQDKEEVKQSPSDKMKLEDI